MPKCHFDSYNLWILKPTHLNRGRGIHVFRDLDTLNKLIKQYCTGKEPDTFEKKRTKTVDEKADDREPGSVPTSAVQPADTDTANAAAESTAEQLINEEVTSSPSKKQTPAKNQIKFNTFII